MEQINRLVAERIRALRQEKAMSLEEVGRAAGVSRGMLSQIETLKTNPTIAVLWKIAAGLGVSFSELLDVDQPAPAAQLLRAKDARYLYSADRQFRSRPLLSTKGGRRVELYQLRLEPGAEVHAEAHPSGSQEQLLVIGGKACVTVGGQEYQLGAGDALLFAADTAHGYRTLGNRPFAGLSLILYG